MHTRLLARMCSGSSKRTRITTCKRGQLSLLPALKEANGRADQPQGHAEDNFQMQKPSVFLPQDIWERVAMHMATEDWVRASGTCKTMVKVQLPHISLGTSAADAIVWSANHSRTTESFLVRIYDWNHHKSSAVSAAVPTDGWDLSQLHVLRVRLEPKQTREHLWSWAVRLASRRPKHDAQRWMVDMLSSASNAKQIHLMGVNLVGPALPSSGFLPFPNLAELCISTFLSPQVCSSIKHLSALKSLRISKGPGLPDMQALPAMNLKCCTALCELVLENVMFRNFRFPNGVNLQLDWLYSVDVLAGWNRMSDRCGTLSLRATYLDIPQWLAMSVQLPGMFWSRCPLLRELKLHSLMVGRANDLLMLDLPSLTHLDLKADDVNVRLSGQTCPSTVHISTARLQSLTHEDVAAFAAGINDLDCTECQSISESTKVLLECFDDPRIWKKTSETCVRVTHRIHLR